MTWQAMWVTQHGLERLERERGDLRLWLAKINGRIRRYPGYQYPAALAERRIVEDRLERVQHILKRAKTVPECWAHKREVCTGDTVYLRHKDTIRIVTLIRTAPIEPINGKLSIMSPLGHKLLGKHPGARVRLPTLDGDELYEIMKIV